MQTPASRWRPSTRVYDPHLPRWEYPADAWVLKVDCKGKTEDSRTTLDCQQGLDRRMGADRSPRGEQGSHVYYCTTLIREIDPGIHRSTLVERWIPTPTSNPEL